MQKLRNHRFFILPKFLIFSAFLTACSNSTDNNEKKTLKPENSQNCSYPSLASTSEDFLNALKEENIELAKSFYQSASYADGYYHGVTYTFFPKENKYNIFDFQKTNAMSEFEVDILGEYSHYENYGMLVLFIQQDYKHKRLDERFLSETKFKNYFVCYFECLDEQWKIAGNHCFEDSGGPFFPTCEEGETGEYCPSSSIIKE